MTSLTDGQAPDPQQLTALTQTIVKAVEEACPDQPKMLTHVALLAAANIYLQSAAYDQVVAEVYRKGKR